MDAETVVKMVLVALPTDVIPSEEQVNEAVTRLANAFGLDPAVRAEVLQKVQARGLVKMDVGFALVDRHVPWVSARRAEIDPFYWERFKLWLQREGWPSRVISGLDRTTDDILDLLGNPAEKDTWKRRGLVMGDVQSGKTATYSALINKAADAGYRFIILLTGTLEMLRQQTQERLDFGFVGFDSGERLKRNRRNLRVGVGTLDKRRDVTIFTSTATDFRVATVNSLGLSLNSLNDPAIVVIKKHTRIMENLRDWLQGYNTTSSEGIDIPMLLIDDEADNASVNTNEPAEDPTAVNAGIRSLLALFRRTTYVGFTATPFANIFIHPDTVDADVLVGDDLFPRDFIYVLQAPSNYFGPRRIFQEENGSRYLCTIKDVDAHLPARHKSDARVDTLPESLHEALRAFLLANAIRDLRGEGATHRTMLVNVSQFTKVQDQIEVLVDQGLKRLQTDVRNFGLRPPAEARANASLAALAATFERVYAGCEFDWPTVQRALGAAVLPIITKAVNMRTGARSLDYREHKDNGLRVIAVGGNSLSRGLTLEGLVVSYFRRTTKMYDTLLQMGRWFGYRPGYEDLCRVWLPAESIDWYGHISDSIEELRWDLRQMFLMKKTPKEFGLKVRAHPDSLIVTARNKMRTATEISRVVSLSAQGFESVELSAIPADLKENWRAVSDFVSGLECRNISTTPVGTKHRFFRGATRREVMALLRRFRLPLTEYRFQPNAIADLLERLDLPTENVGDVALQGLVALEDWDVVIPAGEGDSTIQLGGVSIQPQKRLVRYDSGNDDSLVVSGQKRRVGSRGIEKAGMSDAEIKLAEQDALAAAAEKAAGEGRPAPTTVNIADHFLRQKRSRPLLLIHVIAPTLEGPGVLPLMSEGAMVAIGLSFPGISGSPMHSHVRYKINIVKARELFGAQLDFGDDIDDPEAP